MIIYLNGISFVLWHHIASHYTAQLHNVGFCAMCSLVTKLHWLIDRMQSRFILSTRIPLLWYTRRHHTLSLCTYGLNKLPLNRWLLAHLQKFKNFSQARVSSRADYVGRPAPVYADCCEMTSMCLQCGITCYFHLLSITYHSDCICTFTYWRIRLSTVLNADSSMFRFLQRQAELMSLDQALQVLAMLRRDGLSKYPIIMTTTIYKYRYIYTGVETGKKYFAVHLWKMLPHVSKWFILL